MVWVWVKFAA